MSYKVKVCGMRDGENIRQVTALGVDWIGMVFWDKSPRNVTMIPTHAGIIPDRADSSQFTVHNSQDTGQSTNLTPHPSPLRVGVFVDEMAQNIITRVVNYKLDIIQLHGHERPTLIRNLRATIDPDLRPGIKMMKAISVSNREDIEAWHDYADCVDYLLFDTKCATAGGSGQQFDWQLLEAYDGDLPFLLSGGIGPDDADRVKAFHHPRCIGIDLNSRFEIEPGLKDVEVLKRFIEQLKE
jgi:phosphoribosylanthranilate isomerase